MYWRNINTDVFGRRLILIATGVGSWKIIVSVFAGAYGMGLFLNLVGSNPFTLMPAHYHLVIGGLAFGAVFMATDPVTAAQTETGKVVLWFFNRYIYRAYPGI